MATANRLKKWRENNLHHKENTDNKPEEIEGLSNAKLKPFKVFKTDPDKPIKGDNSMNGGKNSQIVVLKDFYRYGVISREKYLEFLAILSDKNASEEAKNAVMRKLRAGL